MNPIEDHALRVLYRADLRAISAFHVGSPDTDVPAGGAPCRVEATGEPYVPGSSLAGRLVETIRTLFEDFGGSESGHAMVTSKFDRARGRDLAASRVEVRSAYPHPVAPPLHARDRVAIDPELGVAADREKFKQIEVPCGTRFRLLVEVDLEGRAGTSLSTDEREALVGWVETALCQWTRFGRVGGHSSAGCGWFVLENLRHLTITPENLAEYLDMKDPRCDADAALTKLDACTVMKRLEEVDEVAGRLPLAFTVEVAPGKVESGYGWESLLVGGGEFWAAEIGCDGAFIRRYRAKDNSEPDQELEHELYVPGSSVKGALKSFLRRVRAAAAGDADPLGFLFGEPASDKGGRAGVALFGDLALPRDHRRQIRPQIVHRHAEDEFAGGVFASALFDEEAFCEGQLRGWVVCDSPDKNHRDWFRSMREVLQAGAEAGLLGLGAGGSRVKWTVGEMKPDFTLAAGET